MLCFLLFRGQILLQLKKLSALEIEIGDGSCSSIIILNDTMVTCVPPQFSSDTADIMVSS